MLTVVIFDVICIAFVLCLLSVAIDKAPLVLDIGTGTGLLAMMAARAGAAHVIACEMFPGLCGIARGIIADNGLHDRVTVVEGKSTDIPDITSLIQNLNVTSDTATAISGLVKCDMVVSELLDQTLVGEGMYVDHWPQILSEHWSNFFLKHLY